MGDPHASEMRGCLERFGLRALLLVALVSACGRIDYDPVPDGARPGLDAASGPETGASLPGPWTVGTSACGTTSSVVVVDAPVVAGSTLLVALFQREPAATDPPSIAASAAGLAWALDASFYSVETTNRRHLALFRAPVTAAVPAGATLTVRHPEARATGVVAVAVPGAAVPVPEEPVTTAEGEGVDFAIAGTTAGNASLCLVAHGNQATATFGPDATALFDFTAACGDTRNSARLHAAVVRGTGPVRCEGTMSDPFQWAAVLRSYDDLPR